MTLIYTRAGIWDEESIWICMRAMLQDGCRRGMESGAIIIGGAGQRAQDEGLHTGTEAGGQRKVRTVRLHIVAEAEELQAEKVGWRGRSRCMAAEAEGGYPEEGRRMMAEAGGGHR